MCWLYFVPNLLVIQHVETLYLGGNNVKVVCERVWRNSRCVHSKESHNWILWLASRQSGTHVKHVESWRVTTAGALQDKKYSLAWKLFRDSNSWLIPVVRPSCHNALFGWKLTFHIPYIPYYKYIYSHEM